MRRMGEPSDCNASLNPEEGRKTGRGGKTGKNLGGHGSEESLARLTSHCLKQSCLWEEPWISRRVTKGTRPRSMSWEQPTQCGLSTDSVVDLERRWPAISQQAGWWLSDRPNWLSPCWLQNRSRELMPNHWDGARRGPRRMRHSLCRFSGRVRVSVS